MNPNFTARWDLDSLIKHKSGIFGIFGIGIFGIFMIFERLTLNRDSSVEGRLLFTPDFA